MRAYCGFCGRRTEDCPGGLWRFGRSREHSAPAICRYCARAAVRAFGEQPDAAPSVIAFPVRGGGAPEPEPAA